MMMAADAVPMATPSKISAGTVKITANISLQAIIK
jgi:hypothetical protein